MAVRVIEFHRVVRPFGDGVGISPEVRAMPEGAVEAHVVRPSAGKRGTLDDLTGSIRSRASKCSQIFRWAR